VRYRSLRILIMLTGLSAASAGISADTGDHAVAGDFRESLSHQGQGINSRNEITTRGNLLVVQPWLRATIGRGRISAAYLRVENRGEEADRLVAVSSPVAGRVELHTHLMQAGVMRMRQIESVEVNTDEPAVFQPGGNHIMLMDLNRPLKSGDSIPITLVFEKTGSIDIQAIVKGLNERSGEGARTDHSDHAEGRSHSREHEMKHDH